MEMRPGAPVGLEIVRQHDEDLELLAGAHNDLGELIEVTWTRKDGSILKVLTHATEEAREYLAARRARQHRAH
jgi:hypothetical protein